MDLEQFRIPEGEKSFYDSIRPDLIAVIDDKFMDDGSSKAIREKDMMFGKECGQDDIKINRLYFLITPSFEHADRIFGQVIHRDLEGKLTLHRYNPEFKDLEISPELISRVFELYLKCTTHF